MKRYFLFIIAAMFSAFAQEPPSKNPTVEKILKEISADNIKASVEKLVSFGTRHTLSDTVSETRGIGAARRWIKSEFERYAKASGGRLSVAFHESTVPPSTRIPNPTNVINVVATLKPKNPNSESAKRLIVVGGHYDSRASDPMDARSDAPGANDDGSGTALVLELARVMSKYEFDATLVFIAFAAEEQGLFGAGAWAKMAKDNGWNVEAVFNNDIVGNSMGGDGVRKNEYVRLFSEAFSAVDTGMAFRRTVSLGHENDGGSRSLARYIKEIAERYNPDFSVKMVYRLDRFSRGGDHRPFHQLGFSAVRFSVATENYDWQHQDVRAEKGKEYGDLVKFMDFDYCANIARANAAGMATLANAPAPPENCQIVAALGYETVLRWNKNTESDLAGYFVRSRETTSPVWQHQLFTSDTTVSLKATKDEYLFGIQAVDKDGNASLVSMPRAVGR
ncbi:MAG: M28 family peptidase [Ignavibacteriae bacterium]|nr:M28 family peptidase [Ignavibacteriota bacterium]